jgi:streptomycin 3"-adenylyltransferase
MKIILKQTEQMQAVKTAMCSILGNKLLAIYLHGSIVAGGLRPQSDIDFLAVINCPLTDEQRRKLLTILLQISGRYPATSGNQRCIEVMVFLQSDLFDHELPMRTEFIYGELCKKWV